MNSPQNWRVNTVSIIKMRNLAGGHIVQYTTDCSQNSMNFLYNRYKSRVSTTYCTPPYDRLRIPVVEFKDSIFIYETEILSIAVMALLLQYIYPILNGYAKANIIFYLQSCEGNVFAKPINKKAIPLTFDTGEAIPKSDIYACICDSIIKLLELYEGLCLKQIAIKVYFLNSLEDKSPPFNEDLLVEMLSECLQPTSEGIKVPNMTVKRLNPTNKVYSNHITAIKKSGNIVLEPFFVADTETVVIDHIHVPYALGVMMVVPGEEIKDNIIDTFFSEDYLPSVFPTFQERSTIMIKAFIARIETITRSNRLVKRKSIYFHNLSKFDGIFILKHMAIHHPNYRLKPLIRDNILYEIAVYSKNRHLFTFKDSLKRLSGDLKSLAKNLCPQYGSKGSLDYDSINQYNLLDYKHEAIEYMRQDILLLGGVMQKFQEFYFKLYRGDVVKHLTTASLALSLFREKYYDDVRYRIHIPSQNEDSFIRSGFYGGHCDAYIPYGKNLHYYDVNSLYPYCMKKFQMPGGVPVWHNSFDNYELSNIFGFIEAIVECPLSIERPFLPYRDEREGTLIFPVGTFKGIYFSEELKLAETIGYKIKPVCGYTFDKMDSPFKDYVTDLFESRTNAKKEGKHAFSYVYKLLMNSLYGRFGIDPQSTKTEMCSLSRRNTRLSSPDVEFVGENKIRENLYMVSYLTNPGKGPSYWEPLKNAAVQIAAAITAYARIHMYEHIKRVDCYYTDTDSVVLGNPLPDEYISSSELGMFKLENIVKEGYYVAPKCYGQIIAEDDKEVLKFKGPAKGAVDIQWFKDQYANPTRSIEEMVSFNFRADMKELVVRTGTNPITLKTDNFKKRIQVFENGVWVGTKPRHIDDQSFYNRLSKTVVDSLKKDNYELSEKLKRAEMQLQQYTGLRPSQEVESLHNDVKSLEEVDEYESLKQILKSLEGNKNTLLEDKKVESLEEQEPKD